MKVTDKKQILLYITYTLVLFFVLYHFKTVLGVGGSLLGMIMPFLVGAGIAFLLSLPMNFIERSLMKCDKKGKLKKGKRPLSLILTLILFILIIFVVVMLVIPAIIDAVEKILVTVPPFLNMVVVEMAKWNLPVEELEQWVSETTINWAAIGEQALAFLKTWSTGIVSSTVGVVSSVIGVIADGVISLIFAIYILCAKESLYGQFKMLSYAFLPEKASDELFRIGSLVHRTFKNFFTGQCLEACILGSLFMITMAVLRIPYAVLIGVLIGITSLIPIFGAFIGCAIGAFLIVMVEPMKALVFVVVFLILQQIEGNLIYPKVVGGSVGLPGIWVLVAVSVGGSMMGVLGMILFIPAFSVLYALIREKTVKNLKEKAVSKEKYRIGQ